MKGLQQKAEEAIKKELPSQLGVGSSGSGGSSANPLAGALGGSAAGNAAYDGYKGTLPPPLKDDGAGKVGVILFSKKPIQGGKEDAAALTNQFTGNDPVHAIAYLSGSVKQLRFTRSYEVMVMAEGTRPFFAEFRDDTSVLEKRKDGGDPAAESFFTFDVMAQQENASKPHITLNLMRRINGSIDQDDMYGKAKTYEMAVSLKADGSTVATGTFYYKVAPENVAAFKKMYNSLEGAETASNGLPRVARNDPVLNGQIKKLMTNYKGRKLVNVVLHKPEWTIVRHELSGAILRRGINAYAVFQENAQDCQAVEFYFEDQYVGSSFLNQPSLWGGTARTFNLLCANAK